MPRPPVNPASLPPEERHLRSQLHQLLSRAEGLVHGSLIEVARRCGKPSCRCATDDEARHRSLYLGRTREGKTTMEYVPKHLEETVRQWVEDCRAALELIERINSQGRARLKESKRRARPAPSSGSRRKAADSGKRTPPAPPPSS